MYSSKYSDLLLIFTVYIINIILYFITFSWIVLLEKNKCDCSKNWKRDFIKYYILSMILFIVIYGVYEVLSAYKLVKNYDYVFDFLRYVMFISEIGFVSIVFIYIRDLIRKRCKCSESPNRDISLFYSFTDLMIFAITGFMAFVFMIYRAFIS